MILDDLSRAGVSDNLSWLEDAHPRRLEVHAADVCDAAALRRVLVDVDQVFHFAAQVAVTTSVAEPTEDFRVNLVGTHAARLAHLAGLRWSPTMWRMAHPWDPDLPNDAQVAEEEETVLRFQGILDKAAPRPWDLAEVPAKAPLRW